MKLLRIISALAVLGLSSNAVADAGDIAKCQARIQHLSTYFSLANNYVAYKIGDNYNNAFNFTGNQAVACIHDDNDADTYFRVQLKNDANVFCDIDSGADISRADFVPLVKLMPDSSSKHCVLQQTSDNKHYRVAITQ